MNKETIKISGMTCAACAQRVQKAVAKLDGVADANVNFATEKLSVEFDEQKVSVPAITDAVVGAGYGVIEDSKLKIVTIPIGGMTCASCSQRVEKAISKLNGVTKVSVNLATEKAAVEYDPQLIKLSAIKECIVNTGYQALEIDKNTVDEDKLRKEKEIRTLWIKFIIAATFGIPLLYFAMAPMVTWWPFPIPEAVNPMQFPLRYALLQITLVTPIVIAGYRFYTVGFKALLQRSPNMDSLVAIGTSAAIIFSIYNTFEILNCNFMAVEKLYYETAGVIIALILLGKSLEAVSKGKTSDAIKKLMGLAPKTATVIENGKEIEVPLMKQC